MRTTMYDRRRSWAAKFAAGLAAVALAATVTAATPSGTAQAAGTVTDVVVNQAGYSAGAYKSGHVVADGILTDRTYQVLDGAGTVIASGNLVDQGATWGQRVYSADFSAVTQTGALRLRSNGVTSHPFQVQANIWDSYTDEMTAFYRIQRASVATADAYPAGYSSVAPSPKVFHAAGHLDDAASVDGTQHHDLTGGWYDAGDYGKYGGNQWVTGQIAIAYLRHADSPSLQYDNDDNGVPDLIDEARVGSEYLVKVADEFDGAMYDLANNGGFRHPEFVTDNVSGTADDRRIRNFGVGGSAKAAGSLAATARAIEAAVAGGNVDPALVTELTAFAADCSATAELFYDYAAANPTGPVGSYGTVGGIPNSMLWAEVQLFLLTGDTGYSSAATSKINALTFGDLRSTNYWDQRPISLAEFYPAADTATKDKIRTLLRQQADYFLSSSDDTPYGVLNVFGGFGVNEPHVSYVGDLIRYYELFGDPTALRGALRGLGWVLGDNPWNISWVSGVGADHVDFLHTRLDEEAYDHENTGIVIPGAMVSGPNIKNPTDIHSVSPWYEDRPLWADDVQQWRYNEYSISIQAGLLYSVMALADINDATSGGGTVPPKLPITSPLIGDTVTGEVTVLAQPGSGLASVEVAGTPMTLDGDGVWNGTFDVSASAPYAHRQISVRGVWQNGRHTHSTAHVMVSPPLQDPSHPLLYDNFSRGGTFGATGFGWVNWFNQSGGTGTFAAAVVDGRDVGLFTQTPSSASSLAKFQPWHDFGDFSGYRYLELTMKNPGYPGARYRLSASDGVDSCSLSGGSQPVATTWTVYRFDLNACPAVDRGHVQLSYWLQQTGGVYGELLVDEIRVVNDPAGTQPTLTAGGVSPVSGTSTTPFTYTVTYTDADNQPPHVVDVVVGGVVHHMTATDPADTTYTDGKTYAYTTLLVKGGHSYYFRTTDTTSDAVRTTTQTGPDS